MEEQIIHKKNNEDTVIAAIEIGANEVGVIIGKYSYKEVWILEKELSTERSKTYTPVTLERIDVLGYAVAPSKGFVNGKVKSVHLDIAVNTVLNTLKRAETMANCKTDRINIVLNEKNISFENSLLLVHESFSPTEIQESLIDQFIADLSIPNNESILDLLHVNVIDYVVDDDLNQVVNPSWMTCNKVQANVQYIYANKNETINVNKLMSNAKINDHNIILRIIANSNAVLNEQEKYDGVILLTYNDDENIDLTIIKGEGNSIIHFSSYACDSINLDFIVSKVLFTISQFVKCNNGIVLVGNHKNLNGLYYSLQKQTEVPVRIGIPQNVFSSLNNYNFSTPEFATLIGLLKS